MEVVNSMEEVIRFEGTRGISFASMKTKIIDFHGSGLGVRP